MKMQKYKLFKYSDQGILEKKRTIELNRGDDLVEAYERNMGIKFDPETSYIKPVISRDKKQQITLDVISKMISESASDLLNGVKNKYAVADELKDLSDMILKKKYSK